MKKLKCLSEILVLMAVDLNIVTLISLEAKLFFFFCFFLASPVSCQQICHIRSLDVVVSISQFRSCDYSLSLQKEELCLFGLE